MRFLVDAQLPPALVRWLADEGHEAEHVADREMQAASDAAIWDYALATSAAIITKDEDFAQRKVLTAAGRPLSGSGCRTRGAANCWNGSRR
jgi:predicted nuclease of predicted toxin-antitoxin system